MTRLLRILAAACCALAGGVLAAAPVTLGIDVLLEKDSPHLRQLEGKRVGLITNPSGVDGKLIPTVDRLAADERVQLVRLYAPEHGIRGDVPAGDPVGDETDKVTGLPVTSLYGKSRQPTAESLADINVLLLDLQDVGSRTYTYISTMGEALRACAAHRKPLVILDRPNPLGGLRFEGPVIRAEWYNFIGWGPVPISHGMTMGEIARYFRQELSIDCELQIVPMRGWRRDMIWADTGLAWTITSPHIPHPLQAHLYITTGMLAASFPKLSDGVGSTMPFELIAADFIDGTRLAQALNALGLPGVAFQPVAVRPFYGKFANQSLSGVRLRLIDARAYQPLHTALQILGVLHRLYPARLEIGERAYVARHWGASEAVDGLQSSATSEGLESSWRNELEAFGKRRAESLLY